MRETNRILSFVDRMAALAACLLLVCPALRAQDEGKHQGLISRVVNYFSESNKPHPERRIDFSFIGGPHYSSETGLGLGLVAAANYSTCRGDTLTPLSEAALYADVATAGFYKLGLRGTHITRADRMRLDYDLNLYCFDTHFWGIGYKMAENKANDSRYREFHAEGRAHLLANLGGGFFAGPGIDIAYTRATRVERPALWINEPLRVFSPGFGLMARYDTRDNLTAPERGWLVTLTQRFYPRFLAGRYCFSATEFSVANYLTLWRGGVLASRVHGRWAYGRVPWSMLSTMADGAAMRGYYEGRYRDKAEADITFELRQHVWRRSGIALWVGAATVAPSPAKMQMRHVLPNVGIGYRWEFKRHVNVRLDFGIGRGTTGFNFNINEAF